MSKTLAKLARHPYLTGEVWSEGEDGYWGVLRPGLYCDRTDCHTVHEWNLKDFADSIREVLFCDCAECVRELDKRAEPLEKEAVALGVDLEREARMELVRLVVAFHPEASAADVLEAFRAWKKALATALRAEERDGRVRTDRELAGAARWAARDVAERAARRYRLERSKARKG